MGQQLPPPGLSIRTDVPDFGWCNVVGSEWPAADIASASCREAPNVWGDNAKQFPTGQQLPPDGLSCRKLRRLSDGNDKQFPTGQQLPPDGDSNSGLDFAVEWNEVALLAIEATKVRARANRRVVFFTSESPCADVH